MAAQKSSSNFQSVHFGKQNASKQVKKLDKQEKEGRLDFISCTYFWVNKFCNFFLRQIEMLMLYNWNLKLVEFFS